MAAPDKIGPYPIVRKLGEGGMGVVYEVHDPQLGRPMALKLLRALGGPSRATDRFWREAEALGKVQHPGVVKIHFVGRTPAGPYMVQELVAGEPLDRALERGPFDPRRAAEVTRDLTLAVGAVHERGLLHRDLKPANVILRPTGQPVLIDFGLAWDAQAETLTRTGAAMGTPAYMAPEQARGLRSAELDERCDVYGLGVIFYELLTGRCPFEADAAIALFAKVLTEEPEWPAALRPDVPPDLDAICRRAMAKEREQRYPSPRALRDDLERFLRGEPLDQATSGSSASALAWAVARAARRRPGRMAVVGLTLLALALGVGAALVVRARQREEVARALVTDLEAWTPALGAAASPRLIEQVERALAGADALRAAGADGPAARRLAATAERARAGLSRARLLGAAEPLVRASGGDAVAIEAALAAASCVPPSTPPDVEVEEVRGAVLLLAGLHDAAREAFARAARTCAPAREAEPEAWLSASRRVWLLAWTDLACGDAVSAEGGVAQAPPLLRARLAAAAAALAPDDEAAAARERALALLPRERTPATELVALALDVDETRRRADASDDARLDLLARARALSLPPTPDRVPPALQAEACLLEGELALGLGWTASAAEAFARRDRLAGGAPPPCPLVPVATGAGLALASPDLAARIGEARARALDLDDDLAASSEAVARARARRHPRLADAPLEATPDPRLATRLRTAGLAALAAARARAEPSAGAPSLAVARRALRLALRARPDDALAWAGLAQAEALAGAPGPAREALGRAATPAPAAWAPREAAALVALAAGEPQRAREEVEAALAALDGLAARPLERAQRTVGLLRDAHARLRAGGYDVDALALLDLLSRRADADRLPLAARKAQHQALLREATRLARTELVAAARARLEEVEALEPPLARARRRIDAELRRRKSLIEVLAQDDVRALLAASPSDARVYLDDHNLGGRLRAGGFDSLVLAFELDAPAALAYMTSFDPRNVAPELAATTRASIAALAEPGPPDDALPERRDDALRAAVGSMYALEVRAALPAVTLRAAHAAALEFAARRPESLAGALALARLQVGVGDFAGALGTLAHAERLAAPLRSSGADEVSAWVLLYRALAHGGLRQPDEARRCLERLVELPARRRPTIRGHRVRDEPLLWADRAAPSTCPGWAIDLAAALDAE